MENKVSQEIPAKTIEEVVELLNKAKNLLSPYCITLTVEERSNMAKMSDGTLSFVSKAQEHAVQHPEFLPSYVSVGNWKIDMQDVNGIKQMDVVLDDVTQLLSDTGMEAGHEAYQAALAFYYNVKRASADGIAGAKPIYEELKVQFVGKRHKKAIAIS